MDKYCEVVVRGDAILVFGNTETQPGVRLTGQPVTKLPREAHAGDLGQAVLSTLDAYRTGVRHPSRDEWKALEQQSLKGTGFTSWRTLSKGASRLGIKTDGASVEITPTVADRRGGYADIVDRALRSRPDPVQVGTAILDSLQYCDKKSKLP